MAAAPLIDTLPSVPWWGLALAAPAGVTLWSLVEYFLHRFLGHDRRTLPNGFASEHIRHHSEGDYFAPTWKKALVAVVAAPVVSALATLALGLPLGAVFGASFVVDPTTGDVIRDLAAVYELRGSAAPRPH